MACSLIPEGSFVLTESSKVGMEESYGYKALEILWTLHDKGANNRSVVDPISMVNSLHFHITLVKHGTPQWGSGNCHSTQGLWLRPLA